MQQPKPTSGMRHVALVVKNFEDCVNFYTKLLGMKVEWHPDADNVYLTSGNDNLALHRAPADFHPNEQQRLGHIGFILEEPEQVKVWHEFLQVHKVTLHTLPRQHRDGAHSFYCADPDGNVVQMIYHPPLVKKK